MMLVHRRCPYAGRQSRGRIRRGLVVVNMEPAAPNVYATPEPGVSLGALGWEGRAVSSGDAQQEQVGDCIVLRFVTKTED